MTKLQLTNEDSLHHMWALTRFTQFILTESKINLFPSICYISYSLLVTYHTCPLILQVLKDRCKLLQRLGWGHTEAHKRGYWTERQTVGISNCYDERHTSTCRQKQGVLEKKLARGGGDEALFLLLDVSQIVLNSWHSRVINWKWNRNLYGSFLWCFHSEHSSVLVSPLARWQARPGYIVSGQSFHFNCLQPCPILHTHTHTHSFQTQWGHIHSDHVQHVNWHVKVKIMQSGAWVYSLVIIQKKHTHN